MMETQGTLMLGQSGGDVSRETVELLVWLLRGRGWTHASEILVTLDMPDTERNRRWVREVANASGGVIASAPGVPYRLTAEIPPEEIGKMESLRTQVRQMARRYVQIMRVWHAHERKEKP